MPLAGGRVAPPLLATEAQHFGTSGSSAVDAQHRLGRQTLRAMVADLRQRLCSGERAPPHTADDDGGRFAFTCDEVERILAAAHTTEERLVVFLLLTTGLRIGGLARLALALPPRAVRAADLPASATAVEKNGAVRTVQLSAVCRVLLARWWRDGRRGPPPATSGGGGGEQQTVRRMTMVFPGRHCPDVGVSTRHLWGVCRRVLDRADVRGSHAHPHTFRHTVVQLLYLVGELSFETIAKWIGHRSSAVTSGVYGRLQQADLQTRLRGVPFLSEDDGGRAAAALRQRWHRVAEAIRNPLQQCPDLYEDAVRWEWEGLPGPAKPSEDHGERVRCLVESTLSMVRRRTGQ